MSLVAAGAGTVALYLLLKEKLVFNACGVREAGEPVDAMAAPRAEEAFRRLEHQPNTVVEALVYLKEVFKYAPLPRLCVLVQFLWT